MYIGGECEGARGGASEMVILMTRAVRHRIINARNMGNASAHFAWPWRKAKHLNNIGIALQARADFDTCHLLTG